MSNEAFKALADPTRRKILKLLDGAELSAGEIGSHFDMSAPSVSHHLSVLKAAELVEARKNGQQVIYSVNTTVMQDFYATLLDLFGKPKENES